MGRKFWTCGLIAALTIAAGCSERSEDAGSAATDTSITSKATDTANTTTPTDSTPQPVRRRDLAVASGTDSSSAVETSEPASDEAETEQGEEPRWATGDSDYLFDQDRLHTFEITLSDAALAELDGDPTAEEYVEGALTFEGETVDEVGVRTRGRSARSSAARAGRTRSRRAVRRRARNCR